MAPPPKNRWAAAMLLPLLGSLSVIHAEQWDYAMQTGHGDHSIQVDVDSLKEHSDYLAARLLFEYYRSGSAPASAPVTPRSALVEGAFDCKGMRYQALSRTEYALAEARGAAGASSRTPLAADRWRPASADPETFAIVDWVCSVAAHKFAAGQASSMP